MLRLPAAAVGQLVPRVRRAPLEDQLLELGIELGRRRNVVDDHRRREQLLHAAAGDVTTETISALSAATPGSARPSIHSRNAPPAVETKVKSPRHAGMVERRDRIAAAGHRDQRPFLGQRRRGLRQRHRRCVERRRLERAERPVPDQRPAGLEHVGQRLDRGRADVEDHLVGGDLVHVAGAHARRVGGEFLRHHHVIRQMDRAAGLLRRARRCALASPVSSCSHSDLPTFTPRAARKVLAMPPPMIR